MPQPRQSLRTGSDGYAQGYSGIPNILDLLPRWHERAACRDVGDDWTLWFQETTQGRELTDGLRSPSTLLALLHCETCRVRRDCLEDALLPRFYSTQQETRENAGIGQMHLVTYGVWGATVRAERMVVRDLPVDEAADLLERTRPQRLQRRLDAYWEARRKLRPNPESGELRSRPLRRHDRLIEEKLAELSTNGFGHDLAGARATDTA